MSNFEIVSFSAIYANVVQVPVSDIYWMKINEKSERLFVFIDW